MEDKDLDGFNGITVFLSIVTALLAVGALKQLRANHACMTLTHALSLRPMLPPYLTVQRENYP